MAELGAAAEVLSKYGAWGIVAVLLLVCRALWQRCNNRDDKLVEFAMLAVAAEKDAKSSADKMADAAREMAAALNRLADKVAVRQ